MVQILKEAFEHDLAKRNISPAGLLIIMVGSIFAAELLTTWLVRLLPPLPAFGDAMLDALTLIVVMFPVLYLGAFRPARAEIDRRVQSEVAKDCAIADLQAALAEVKTLQGILPMCANCKKIRDDSGYWHAVEVYLTIHADAEFSHGLCSDCAAQLYPGLLLGGDGPLPGA